jgi:hypothetical protein
MEKSCDETQTKEKRKRRRGRGTKKEENKHSKKGMEIVYSGRATEHIKL